MDAGSPGGFLNLNKPIGPTSRDVVDLVARPLRASRAKVGHAGTLDPLASGVLVVAIGAATRLIDRVQRLRKTYVAAVQLGARSDTLDADGRITPVANPVVPDEDRVRAALAGQVGNIDQVPPQFSALKVGGRRAYDLARAGREFELAPRPVTIDRIDLLNYAWPRLEIEIICSAGTYIRSIAHDIGESLGCGGLIAVLTRTRIGPFALADAIDPTTTSLTAESIPGLLRPMTDAVADLPRLVLSAEQVARIRHGQPLDARRLTPAPIPPGELALIGPDDALVALGESDADLVRPRSVLA